MPEPTQCKHNRVTRRHLAWCSTCGAVLLDGSPGQPPKWMYPAWTDPQRWLR